jgi:mRNA-degrading endonuclease RelE of RelBE toxin-antitoxin system
MSLRLLWRGPALRDLRRLDPSGQRRVIGAVQRYVATERGDVVRLADVDPPEFRLRVGDWRVRFTVDREASVLHVLHVLPRGKAYR